MQDHPKLVADRTDFYIFVTTGVMPPLPSCQWLHASHQREQALTSTLKETLCLMLVQCSKMVHIKRKAECYLCPHIYMLHVGNSTESML